MKKEEIIIKMTSENTQDERDVVLDEYKARDKFTKRLYKKLGWKILILK